MFFNTSNDLAQLGLSGKIWRMHWPLLAVVCAIAAVGVAALYSVAGGSFQPWAEQHAIRVLAGVGLILAVAAMPLRFWLGLAYPVYFVALALLVGVLLFGTQAMGARRWIDLGPVLFQPSEVMKIALFVALARYYQWLPPARVSHPLWVAIPLLLIAAPVVLVLKQPDLGTAVLFAIVGLGIMFLAGVSIFYFLAGLGGAAAAAPIVWNNLHEYQKGRIMTFLDPDSDPLGAGYHITQSKIALGSGGFGGKGFMQGTQSQLDFLPEKHTDFIFTMIAEETGFIGAMGLLSIYGLLLFLLLSMALSCRNEFSRLLVSGAAISVFVYLFINVAMVTGLVPVVGVPLPFVSHGGTSLMTLMLGLGLAMSGYVHRKERLRRGDMGSIW